ncbi:type 1 glutamine amidotransferase domain-containing protein [Marinilactibacillus psychrotolerans]|uniref:type 1 glutamine amidotransferase domain-containing protein n=1 Tax=Marinilactibacillus psychrotolerans TaxID=191770 RepID=UPI001867276E|nr:type 1 glutamine amidotransferase domain-containing protein [Marinilactibacillus psychrotolerans]GEQ32377.1 ThiJ/PfpI family protein protease/amidase [Marinilactibacillus psychrotolerans]
MGKKVATVITKLFEDVEFTSPKEELEKAGHKVVTIGFNAGETVEGKKGKASVTIDKSIDDVSPEDFDALLIPGGFSPDQLRKDERFLNFTRSFSNNKKPIFSICHGPQLLINAEVVKGKDITSVSQVAIDLKNAGANFHDKEVVIDDSGLISSRTPDDLPAFNEAMVNALQ